MCFIANALKQAQSTRIERQLQGQRPAGAINLFVFLRQSDNRKVMQSQSLQLAACRGELAFSTIDNDEIGQTNIRLRIADWSGVPQFRRHSLANIPRRSRAFPQAIARHANNVAARLPPCWRNHLVLPPCALDIADNYPCRVRHFGNRPSRRRRASWKYSKYRSIPLPAAGAEVAEHRPAPAPRP